MHNAWKAWGVSVIGPYHRKENIPNQDAWLSRVFKGGSVLAVSDGLGSKAFSDIGSKAACLSVIEAVLIYKHHTEGNFKFLPDLIHALWTLKTGALNPNDCAATCLFALQINEKIILGRLGDGMVIASGKNQYLIMEDAKTDFFSNMTDCLGVSHKASEWDVREIPADDIEAIILCTDGVANGIDPEKIHEFALSLFDCYRTMERKKRSKEITKWLNEWPVSDDKTLACLFKEDSRNA